jgi:hypothetical protein
MVNVCFMEVLNGGVYGVYFDVLHVFRIWRAWQKEVEDNINYKMEDATTEEREFF